MWRLQPNVYHPRLFERTHSKNPPRGATSELSAVRDDVLLEAVVEVPHGDAHRREEFPLRIVPETIRLKENFGEAYEDPHERAQGLVRTLRMYFCTEMRLESTYEGKAQ